MKKSILAVVAIAGAFGFGVIGTAGASDPAVCKKVADVDFIPNACFCKLEVVQDGKRKYPRTSFPANSEEDCKKKCQQKCDAMNAEAKKKKKVVIPVPAIPQPVDDTGICDILSHLC